ncbi:MAG: hypothetical protein IJ464_07405 [Alistipes sp.]|nr:hypothetical protein [Alistipes sp.]
MSTTVAYENEAYIVNFAVTADYTTTEEYTYTGTIEGLVKPVENEVVDSWNDIETTFTNCSQINIMSGYSEITFIDAKNTLVAEFNHAGIGNEVAVVAGTYTFTTAFNYADFDLTSTTCNGEAPTSGTIIVADNGDATCTFTFDFVVKGCSYKATYTGKSIDFLGKATEEQPGDEITDPNNVTLTTMGELVYGTYYTQIPISDKSGNNSLTLILYPDSVVDGYPVVGSYPYWQSDPGYVWATDRFSFAKNSLKVGGTTYSNNDIAYTPTPTCNVADDGTITLTFTVGGDARTFTYHKQ